MTEQILAEIEVPFFEAVEHHLKFSLGACRFQLKRGQQTEWVTGTYEHPEDLLPLKIEQQGGTIHVQQEKKLGGWGSFFNRQYPTLKLALGNAKPFAMTVNAGAYEGELDLGGLPVTKLKLNQGAGKVTINFSTPNPQRLSEIDVEAGAMELVMKNLSNANFDKLDLDGGASSYKLDFGGTLQRDADVKINAGAASVKLVIPNHVPVKITATASLGSIESGEGFSKRDGVICNEAALAGQTPVLSIKATISLGSLEITSV